MRAAGGAVPGSVFCHTSRSSVGIETFTVTSARFDAACSTSMSRTISGPRVMMPNGLRRSDITSRQPRVSR
jgi:hypothetical protein